MTIPTLDPNRQRWQTAYADDHTHLYHGDALDILRALPDECVDLTLADPPYSSGGLFRGDRMTDTRTKYVSSDAQSAAESFAGDNRDQRAFHTWCVQWLAQCYRIQRTGTICALFTDWRQLPTVTDAIQVSGYIWRGVAVWRKPTGRPNLAIATGHTEFVVWGCKGRLDPGAEPYLPGVLEAAAPRDRIHQTQKPLGLLEQLAGLCRPGGVILDPFAGSATTLVAARTQGRRGIGVELADHYAAAAADRLAQTNIGAAPELADVVPMPEPML